MPTTPGCQPSPQTTCAWRGPCSAIARSASQDALLDLAAVGVEAPELLGDLVGPGLVGREHELDAGVGPVQALD